MADRGLYPPLAALRAFEAVGRLGGIRRAARELSIDHAVVSRHLRSLESWVGIPLINRHGTQHKLTEQGETYHEDIAQALTLIAKATGKFALGEGEQHLRLWCVPGFASLWLVNRLTRFIADNPTLNVDFRPSDESPDFRGKDVDCDIRYLHDWEPRPDRGVHVLEFARPSVFPVASPSFAAQLGPVRSVQVFLDMPLLCEEDDAEWVHWLQAQGTAVPKRINGPRLWHAHVTLNAARLGQGIALANDLLFQDDEVAGRLVRIEPEGSAFAPVRFGAYTLLAREDRWNAPAVRNFRRWIHSVAQTA